MPQTLRELHRQYGDIVRIGPNELAFFSLDATDTILGSKGKNEQRSMVRCFGCMSVIILHDRVQVR